jgi:hypothetical protein
MSVIEKNIKLEGSKGKKTVLTLFDGGATYSCIQKELAEKLANLEPLPKVREFGTAKKKIGLKAKYAVRLDFYINSDRFSDEFMVINGLSDKVIIGAATLQKWRMKLDFENDEIIYDPRVTKLRIV